jgi:hypothetical protein
LPGSNPQVAHERADLFRYRAELMFSSLGALDQVRVLRDRLTILRFKWGYLRIPKHLRGSYEFRGDTLELVGFPEPFSEVVETMDLPSLLRTQADLWEIYGHNVEAKR